MKKEIVYRRFIWVAAVASVVTLVAMMSIRSDAADRKKDCKIESCSAADKMTDLIEIKLM